MESRAFVHYLAVFFTSPNPVYVCLFFFVFVWVGECNACTWIVGVSNRCGCRSSLACGRPHVACLLCSMILQKYRHPFSIRSNSSQENLHETIWMQLNYSAHKSHSGSSERHQKIFQLSQKNTHIWFLLESFELCKFCAWQWVGCCYVRMRHSLKWN